MTAGPPAPSPAQRAEYAILTTGVSALRLLGAGPGAALAAAIGRLGYRPLGIRRRVVESNLRAAFPDRDAAWIRRTAAASYAHLARETFRTLVATGWSRERLLASIDVEGGEQLHAALEAGHGAVVLAGHLGNWELGGATLAALGFPVDAVVRRLNNPLSDRAIDTTRARFGLRTIERDRAPRRVIESLRGNRVVILVADQDARGSGLFVPFFGRPASTPRGPAVFAVRTGAAVVLMLPIRRRDRLLVRFEPIPVEPGMDAESAVRSIITQYSQALERAVRSAPEQYLWHHRRWKTAPPQEPRNAGQV